MECSRSCVLCRQKACRNDKELICGACANQAKDRGAWISALGLRKWQIYENWYITMTPSTFHASCDRSWKAKQQKMKEEEERRRAWYAAENAKPPAQLISELRAKLIEANAIINEQRQRSWDTMTKINERPPGPYY